MTRASLLLLVGCLSARGQEPAHVEEHVNPHASADACASCHEPAAPGTATLSMAFVGGAPDASCKTCHGEDPPHQTGIEPSTAEVPDVLLLVDGKLACITCHDEPSCTGAAIDPLNPRFWRGGPYRKVGDLCHQCHSPTDPNRYDPHAAMKEHPGEPEVCLYCHEQPPQRDKADAEIRVNAQKMCEGCHQDARHVGAGAHLVKPDAEVAAQAAEAHLPLSLDGAIECATCHDVHPAGSTAASDARLSTLGKRLYPTSWEAQVLTPALGERATGLIVEPVERDYLRRPQSDLCAACHLPKAIDAHRREEAP